VGGWHFHFWRHSFPARYWWTVPALGRVTTWFTWTAPSVVWAQTVFYDYGSGGNVVVQDNNVYVGGQRVATAEEYAMSAMDLATVPPPQSDEQAVAHLVLPPTRDTSVVAAMAAAIGPQVMPRPGNDLAAALGLAAAALGESGGSIVVLADAAPPRDESVWRELRNEYPWPVHFLAVARSDTPEWDTLNRAAAALGASITPLTPDSADVLSLVRRTAKAPVAVAAVAAGTRWAEAGWWLVPWLALFSLQTFRRVRDAEAEHATSSAMSLGEPGSTQSEETN